MPYIVDQVLSGDGYVDFSATVVQYWLSLAIQVPPSVRSLESANPDHILRFGWLALGALVNLPDLGDIRFTGPAVWIDFERGRWMPDSASNHGGTELGQWASFMRYHVAAGGSVRVLVYGY